MDSVIAPFSQLLALNSVLLKRCIDGLSDDELWRRPGEHSNPMFWIVGHFTTSRRSLLRVLGGTPEPLAWEPLFQRHEHVRAHDEYPPLADVLGALRAVNQQLRQRMDEATDADLSAPAPRSFPVEDTSIRGAVAFLTYHDTYHLGQLSYLRRWLGYPGVVD